MNYQQHQEQVKKQRKEASEQLSQVVSKQKYEELEKAKEIKEGLEQFGVVFLGVLVFIWVGVLIFDRQQPELKSHHDYYDCVIKVGPQRASEGVCD